MRAGDWDYVPDGLAFKREWFYGRTPDVLPFTPTAKVRSWDLAATAATGSNDPDYTVGALVGSDDAGRYAILDIERFRANPGELEAHLRATALRDGIATPIIIEMEPGSSGKIAMTHIINNVLDGYAARAFRPSGSKTERALPIIGIAERGDLWLLDRRWTEPFLEEATAFPQGLHDDQVDAIPQAHAFLSRRRVVKLVQ